MDALTPTDMHNDLVVSRAGFPGAARPHIGDGFVDLSGATAHLAGLGRIMRLGRGLYAFNVGPATGAEKRSVSGLALPLTRISPWPGAGDALVEQVSRAGDALGWVGASGGTIFVKTPESGGAVLVTTYRDSVDTVMSPLTILQLDRAVIATYLPPEASATAAGGRDFPAMAPGEDGLGVIESEIVLHIAHLGDRRFLSHQWAGNSTPALQIEGFSLRPLQMIAPDNVEYMGFYPGGKHTPWVGGGRFCGSRGRSLPLTGFAVRLAPELNQRFEIVYQGRFLVSGLGRLRRNGDPCLAERVDDPLCAIRIDIIDRGAEQSEFIPVSENGVTADRAGAISLSRADALASEATGLPDHELPAPARNAGAALNAASRSLLEHIQYEINLTRDQFDVSFYVESNSDLKKDFETGALDPLEHFSLIGWREGRNPCAWFSIWHYREAHPDVADSIWNPFAHYIAFGKKEGRVVSPATRRIPGNKGRSALQFKTTVEPVTAEVTNQLAAARDVNKALLAALRRGSDPAAAAIGVPTQRRFWSWWRPSRL